jgi:hypothetical protein
MQAGEVCSVHNRYIFQCCQNHFRNKLKLSLFLFTFPLLKKLEHEARMTTDVIAEFTRIQLEFGTCKEESQVKS